jgi:pimeloyl-ACP methyl ester carboxylesterase
MLKDIPLIVISSGRDMGFSADPKENELADKVFRALQKEMATESPKGKYLIAKNSSHYIQIDEPELVTESIRSVVHEIRDGL